MSTKYQPIPPRRVLKEQLLDERRVVGIDGKVHQCEGQAFKKHECSGGLHMNEVFVTRRDVQGIQPASRREKIITDERNCSIVCGNFHWGYGHSRRFREWFEDVQRERYPNLQEYLSRTWSILTKLGS